MLRVQTLPAGRTGLLDDKMAATQQASAREANPSVQFAERLAALRTNERHDVTVANHRHGGSDVIRTMTAPEHHEGSEYPEVPPLHVRD